MASASGYQAALRALLPDLPADRVASLCVTERGGGHPRAIETRLDPGREGGYEVTGKKRWATLSGDAGVLLVAASAGLDEGGKKRLRLVRVPSDAAGVTRRPMAEPPLPLTPETRHDEVELPPARVSESDVLGPWRRLSPATCVSPLLQFVEDVHVTAAILAYLVREVRLHALPNLHAERLAGLLAALRAVAALDPSAPATHVALAGLLDPSRAPVDELDRVWAKTESPAHARWQVRRSPGSSPTTARPAEAAGASLGAPPGERGRRRGVDRRRMTP